MTIKEMLYQWMEDNGWKVDESWTIEEIKDWARKGIKANLNQALEEALDEVIFP